MNIRREKRILEFVDDLRLEGGYAFYIRLPRNHWMMKSNRDWKELRSTRHRADVVAYDDLNNAHVLYPDGSRRSYITRKEMVEAGLA